MSETVRLSNFASIANAVFNSVSANATAVTAMSIGGHTINATPVFSGNTTMGNLAFSGTGARITGDFSNATLASRVAFQTSVTNASTTLSVIPNGNNTQSDFFAYNSSDPNNASVLLMRAGTLETSIRSATTGTGTLLPMTFFAGGSERMRITTNGDVGIGTTNPVLGLGVFRDNGNGWAAWIGASAAGSRVGLGTRGGTASVQGFNSLGNGADLALNPDSGNVGVGVVSPGVRLDVNGVIQSRGAGGEGGHLNLLNPDNGSTGAVLDVVTADVTRWFTAGNNSVHQIGQLGGTGGRIEFITSAVERMRLTAAGDLVVGTTVAGARIHAQVASSGTFQNAFFASNGVDSDFAVRIRTGVTEITNAGVGASLAFGNNGAERMRITSAGNVGIGTSAPGLRLDVNGDIRGQGSLVVESGISEGGRLRIVNTSKTSSNATFDWSIWNMTGVYGNALTFWRYNGDGSNVGAAMYLADSGNVGIGTALATPAARLHVSTGAVNGTDGILVSGGTTNRNVMMRPSMAAFNSNALVQAGDSGIIFDGGSINTGALVIGPWSSASGGSGMRIDSAGRVTRPTQPAFAAFGGSGITTTGSHQTCVFTSTATNVGGHYNTSNGRFTAPIAGLYHFTWFISQAGTAQGPVTYIFVNGNSVYSPVIAYATAYNNACGSVVLSLNANDFVTISIIAFNSSFSFIDFNYSGFSGFLI